MKYLLLVCCLIFSSQIFSESNAQRSQDLRCELRPDQILKIGCTYNCGRFNSWALKRYASQLDYKIEIVNLRSENQTIDYTEVDGILIPGGSDINPNRYIKNSDPDIRSQLQSVKYLYNASEVGEERDAFEFDLLQDYFANQNQIDQPILGICRGMQVLTVSQGIPLYVDIKTELGIENRNYTLDQVSITNPESYIQQVTNKSNFRAVELHHQGLRLDYFHQNKDRWPNLAVTAVSNEGKIAEALEFNDRPILGVQFHPEYTILSPVRGGIFKWLLKTACINKTKSPQKLSKVFQRKVK